MPPQGWQRAHFPLFKAETWDFSRFVDEVCRYSLGKHVTYDQLIPARRKLILADIADGLERKLVQARVTVTVHALAGGTAVPTQFLVENSFWQNEDPVPHLIDFLTNEGNMIPYEYLYLENDRSKTYLEALYLIPHPEKHKLLISEPEKLFAQLVEFDPLPSEEWFTRYGRYRQDFTWELIAVAWRYIALLPPGEKPMISKLASHLVYYLDDQNLDKNTFPSHAKIYQIARNIIDQRNRLDSQSGVGVSTNPKRPQNAIANRKRQKEP